MASDEPLQLPLHCPLIIDGEEVKRMSLELGGKAPYLVFDDADRGHHRRREPERARHVAASSC